MTDKIEFDLLSPPRASIKRQPKRHAYKGVQTRARAGHRSLCPEASADVRDEKDEKVPGQPGENQKHSATMLQRLGRPSEVMRQQRSYYRFPSEQHLLLHPGLLPARIPKSQSVMAVVQLLPRV